MTATRSTASESSPDRTPPTPSRLTAAAWRVLVVALALREGLSFWTGHPYDLEVWIRTGNAVAHGANPYASFWPSVPGVSFAYPTETLPSAAYPPFWPLIFGGTFRGWEAVGGGNRFVLYFLLKQGPIVGDLVCGVLVFGLVRRWTSDARTATWALALWALFPYDILVSAVWGQLDSITTAVVLGALYLSPPDAPRRAALYGFGIFAKWISAVFLPLEFFRARGLRRLWPLGSVAAAAAISAVTFWGMGWSIHGAVASGTSQTQGGGLGMNLALVLGYPPVRDVLRNVPGFFEAAGWLWVPTVVAAGWIASRWLSAASGGAAELRAMTFVLTLFFLTRWGVYEQYMLYLFAPLIVDAIALHPGRRRFLLFLVGLAQADMLVNNNLGLWFVSPLDPHAWVVASAVDASPGWGVARTDALLALAVLMTVTLAQLAWTLWKDDPNPRPWVVLWRRLPLVRESSRSSHPDGSGGP